MLGNYFPNRSKVLKICKILNLTTDMTYRNDLKFSDKCVGENSADPDAEQFDQGITLWKYIFDPIFRMLVSLFDLFFYVHSIKLRSSS